MLGTDADPRVFSEFLLRQEARLFFDGRFVGSIDMDDQALDPVPNQRGGYNVDGTGIDAFGDMLGGRNPPLERLLIHGGAGGG